MVVSLEDAGARLGELAERALRGEECTITIGGEPLISLVPTPRWRSLVDLETEVLEPIDRHPATIAMVREAEAQYAKGCTVTNEEASRVLEARRRARTRLVG